MRLPQSLNLASLLIPVICLAHGELEPGPNGGEIRMPGAFHVEVVTSDAGVDVYLLDMHFKNPQVADSSVNVILDRGGDQLSLDCQATNSMFSCVLPKDMKLNAGKLIVNASRGGLPAQPMHYELPLKWTDKKTVSE